MAKLTQSLKHLEGLQEARPHAQLANGDRCVGDSQRHAGTALIDRLKAQPHRKTSFSLSLSTMLE